MPFFVGNDMCRVDLSGVVSSPSLEAFVAYDMQRVFVPLGCLSNVVDTTTTNVSGNAPIPLTLRDGYPENFTGAISVVFTNGIPVFRVGPTLSQQYKERYETFSSLSNKVALLDSLLLEINDGSITNRSSADFRSLIFVPDSVNDEPSAEEAQALFLRLRSHAPFSASVLDYWSEDFHGESVLLAASKVATHDVMGLNLDPVFWIWQEPTWKFCHPAFLREILSER